MCVRNATHVWGSCQPLLRPKPSPPAAPPPNPAPGPLPNAGLRLPPPLPPPPPRPKLPPLPAPPRAACRACCTPYTVHSLSSVGQTMLACMHGASWRKRPVKQSQAQQQHRGDMTVGSHVLIERHDARHTHNTLEEDKAEQRRPLMRTSRCIAMTWPCIDVTTPLLLLCVDPSPARTC